MLSFNYNKKSHKIKSIEGNILYLLSTDSISTLYDLSDIWTKNGLRR